MPADLLLEIGTEELPASYAIAGRATLAQRVEALLAELRLSARSIEALATPRRLAVIVTDLADRQTDLSERVVGPPVRAAFGADGAPTKAATGFAARNNVDVSALERTEVPGKKGEYVVCTRTEQGAPAAAVLPDALTTLIAELPWPKAMRWGHNPATFARPVHWLVAILGGEVIGVRFADVVAGRATRGHRFLAPKTIELTGDGTDYKDAMRAAFVLVDPEARRDSIAAELGRIETETGLRVRPDDALLDEVAYLVEYPVGVCGQFDEAFLEVPAEVIVSAMRSHQRYFAMQDDAGALINRFVTVAGTVTRDLDVVRAGNERVLAARLADARFFFTEDRKSSLAERAAKLDSVVFQSKLGSIGDKVRRVVALCARVADAVGVPAAACERAAALCKVDLVTHMVGEFPDLQGVMGRHYALADGEPEAVAAAIEEHYYPRGAADRAPRTAEGAVVGIADRIDTIVGCFAAGLAPTGSADPYALRRAALGVLTILLDREWHLGLRDVVAAAAAGLAGTVDAAAVQNDVLEFLRTRLRGMLVDGVSQPADCVDAALAAGFEDVPDARARASAVSTLRARADFDALGTAFKRVANILKGERPAELPTPDPARFTDAEEQALWDAFVAIGGRVSGHLDTGDYRAALGELAQLKAPVDTFFEKVLVMADDEQVRANRLALLANINATFNRIADFRQLAV